MTWSWHVARIEEIINTVFWLQKPKRIDHSEDQGVVDGVIIWAWIIGKQGGKVCTGFI